MTGRQKDRIENDLEKIPLYCLGRPDMGGGVRVPGERFFCLSLDGRISVRIRENGKKVQGSRIRVKCLKGNESVDS